MTETRNGTRLAQEALATANLVGTEDFDSDRSTQARIPRAINLTHATRTQGGYDLE
jgi:hypothetical protein